MVVSEKRGIKWVVFETFAGAQSGVQSSDLPCMGSW